VLAFVQADPEVKHVTAGPLWDTWHGEDDDD
jgi:hypothetical protein